ncbi:MAG: peptidylprolyl isomerase [Bacteroidales bacterium]|jgi:cyclophilin family peptidyl-prolyl cis-trans isomerase|nr:peptidylprolyl isomerase [Bacteroidota bacterium]
MKSLFSLGLMFISFLFLTSCGQQSSSQKEQKAESQTETISAVVEQADEQPQQTEEPEVLKVQKVIISTSLGSMTAILYNETPIHRDNFIKLAKEGYYDGTLFHRVIKNFMVQGGDPDSRNAKPDQHLGVGGPDYTLQAEFRPEFIHKKGALAAARKGDQTNPEKRSSGSQFYIVQGEKVNQAELSNFAARGGITYSPDQIKIYKSIGGTPFLDQQYTVFGEVIDGFEVIDKIANVQTGANNRPVKDLKMTVKLIDE